MPVNWAARRDEHCCGILRLLSELLPSKDRLHISSHLILCTVPFCGYLSFSAGHSARAPVVGCGGLIVGSAAGAVNMCVPLSGE